MDTKKYLDLVGLGKYDAKIKEYIKTHGSDAVDSLVALIGASKLTDGQKTLIARIAALEAGLGDVNTLESDVKTAVAAILGEATRAKDAEAALDARLDIIEGSADTEGSIAKALADAKSYADGLNTTMDSRVDALETAIGEGGSVADKITTAIEGLDADITSAAVEAGKGIQVQVIEADGKITNVNVTGNFDNKYDAAGAAATVNSALETYKGTNDAAVAAAKKAGDDAQSDLNTYKGTVSTAYETKADATAKLTEAKGYTDTEIGKVNTKIGTVASDKTVVDLINEAKQAATYDDTQVKADIATNASAIATLNGNASTAGSVAKAVADAKSALETEIGKKADSTTVSGIEGRVATIEGDYLKAADKTELAGKIKTNADAIGVLNGEGEGSVKKKIDDAFNDFATKVSDDSVVNTYKELVDYCATHSSEAAEMAGDIAANTTAISNLGTLVGTLPEGTTASNVVAYVGEKVTSVEAKIGDVGASKGTVTERITAIEDELAAAVAFEPISDADIEALFA